MKILAIAGSNSAVSINRQLVQYATTLFSGENQIEVVDMNDFEMPIYKHEIEQENGIPQSAVDFLEKVHTADVLLVSLAEHNGTYSVAFKNVFDWASRVPQKTVWNDVPMLLMATSPGGRGGLGVLEAAENRFPRHGGNIVETYSLPFFGDNFDVENQKIINPEKDKELREKVESLCKKCQ